MTKERLEELKDQQKNIQTMIKQADATSDVVERLYLMAIISDMQNELLRELTMEVECKWN